MPRCISSLAKKKKGIIETTAERSEGTNKLPHASKMTRTDSYKLLASSHLQEMTQCSTQHCQTQVDSQKKGFQWFSPTVPISDSNQDKSHVSSYSDAFWELHFLALGHKMWVSGGSPHAWCISDPSCQDPVAAVPGWAEQAPAHTQSLRLDLCPWEGIPQPAWEQSMLSCPCMRALVWTAMAQLLSPQHKQPLLFRIHRQCPSPTWATSEKWDIFEDE